MAALSVQIAAKRFPAAGAAPPCLALGPVAFTLAVGEVVAIVGPSGCGKTTLLNLVAGLDPTFDGVVRRPPGRLGMVFQEPRLLPWRTVEANLRLVLGDAPDAAARIATILDEVALRDAAPVFASRLSLGMARRVALARALVVRPGLLLLDEPFVSLDPATADRLRLLALALLERHRPSSLLVTHDLREAVMLAHRLLVLSAAPGHLVADLPIALDATARRDAAAVERCRAALAARLAADHGSTA